MVPGFEVKYRFFQWFAFGFCSSVLAVVWCVQYAMLGSMRAEDPLLAM